MLSTPLVDYSGVDSLTDENGEIKLPEQIKVETDSGYEFFVDTDTGAISHHLKVKLARADSRPPKVATMGSAGMDLFLDEDVVIFPDQLPKLVGVGIHAEIPPGYVGIVALRSGINDLTMINGVGIIDSDYRGEIKLKLSAIDHVVTHVRGERLAQMIIIPYLQCGLEIVDELGTTDRGAGGFGSTGIN